jgi:Replication protein A interacting C-terminal
MVQEELREHGIVIAPPKSPFQRRSEDAALVSPPGVSAGRAPPRTTARRGSTDHFPMDFDDCYCITEEEWLDLLAEVESELDREDEQLIQRRQEWEECNFQYQVSNYYQQHASCGRDENDDVIMDDDSPAGIGDSERAADVVLCPICQRANLRIEHHPETRDIIICPNYGTGCSLQLPVTDHPNERQPLLDLKERLHQSYEFHSIHFCPVPFLEFQLITDQSAALGTARICGPFETLLASCRSCGNRHPIGNMMGVGDGRR